MRKKIPSFLISALFTILAGQITGQDLSSIPELPSFDTDLELEEIPEYARGAGVPNLEDQDWEAMGAQIEEEFGTGVLPKREGYEKPLSPEAQESQKFWKANTEREPFYFKITRKVLFSNGTLLEKKEESYIQVHVNNKEIRVSPMFKGSGWEAYEILNREPSWEKSTKKEVEILKAIPCLQGTSMTPEKIATIKLTPDGIEFYRQDGKEGARFLQGGRVRPETIAKIQEWKRTRAPGKNIGTPQETATIIVDMSLRSEQSDGRPLFENSSIPNNSEQN